MQPLLYSKFRVYHIDDRDLDAVLPEPAPLLGHGTSRMVGLIDEPACQVVFEDFFPGAEYRWTVWQDQIDWVTEGKAEITFLLPPDLTEAGTVIAEAPCIYLIPRGTRITWRPLGDGRFRHVSIDFPNPGFSMVMARSLVEPVESGSAAGALDSTGG